MNQINTMLIVGDDKIAAKALEKIEKSSKALLIVKDKSTNVTRVLRLLIKKRMSTILLWKMVRCELKRKKMNDTLPINNKILNNRELIDIIDQYSPARIVLFRAGLLINKEVISKGVPLMNIHCAKIPEYGGLGSIHCALKDKAYKQCATLHQVTVSIDSGEIYDIEPYILNPEFSYCQNETIAYDAGIRLLQRTLQ